MKSGPSHVVRKAAVILIAAAVSWLAFVAPARAQDARRDRPPDAPKPAPKLTKPPKLLEAAAPVYPADAQAAGLEADVKVLISVDATGAVTDVKTPEPAGHGFDEAAIEAARHYHFEPAEFDGTPGPITLTTTIHFRLTLEAPPEPNTPPPPTDNGQPASSQPTGPAAPLEGIVKERGTRKLLAGVAIAVVELGVDTTTDATGHFSFPRTPAGTYHLACAAPGYDKFQESVTLVADKVTSTTVYLRPTNRNPYEATVEGEREKFEVTRRELTHHELTSVPGTFGDPLRVIQSLPGIARAPFGLGLLLIRGSAPGDSGVFIDGHTVPILYHFLGGPSVLNPEFLDSIDLYPGGFPVRFGDFIGGVVDVNTRAPANDGIHGSANINLLDTSVYVRFPVNKDITVAVAGRRSYIDAILPAVLPKPDPGDTLVVVPVYYDYQLRVDIKLPDRDKLTLFGFGSDDKLSLLRSSAADMTAFNLNTHIGFNRLIATYTTHFGDLTLTISPAVGQDVLSLSAGEESATDLTQQTVSLRERLTGNLSKHLHLDAGVDLEWRLSDYNLVISDLSDVNVNSFGGDPNATPQPILRHEDVYSLGAYLELGWDLGHGVRVIPGFRADVYLLNGRELDSIDPRLVVRWTVAPKTTLKAYAGIFHEAPPPESTDDAYGNPNMQLERAIHTGVGVEQKLTKNLEVSAELYYIDRSNLEVFEQNEYIQLPDGTERPVFFNNDGIGHTYGLEILVKHNITDRLFGWLSYTLSRSVIWRHPGDPASQEQPTSFDQTHNLIGVISYKLGRGWETGARIQYTSGDPTTPVIGSTFNADTGMYERQLGPAGSARMPDFLQLDVRIEKQWLFKLWSFSAFLDIINVTNNENPQAIQYDYRFQNTAAVRGVPIVPTIGIKGQW